MDKTLYFNKDKDYEKLLQRYYDNSYSTSWLKGYVACLYGSMIIDDVKRHKLNSLIGELREDEILKDREIKSE